MNLKREKSINNAYKTILAVLIVFIMILSLASCGKPSENDNSSVGESSDLNDASKESLDESDSSFDSSLILPFPENKMSHSFIDDGNYYLKVQTVNGEKTYIREFAAKGKDAYANLKENDKFEWFYSNGNATFSFDDEKKIYEIYSFSPLFITLFSNEKIEEGECKFFNVDCKYVKYKFQGDMSIIHFYRKTDDSWLGFQYMHKDEYEEVNLVLDVSDEYPEHVVFSIPDDYKYYFESGENEVSINWD